MDIVLFCLVALFSQSSGQLVSPGKCPEAKPADDFDEKKIMGKWYEGWRTNNAFEPDFQCVMIDNYRDESGYVVMHATMILPNAGIRLVWDGQFVPKNHCQPGEYRLTFPSYATSSGFDCVFTDADWSSWMIMYGCQQLHKSKSQLVWIWVKDPDTCDLEDISEALSKLGLCFDDLLKTNQTNCPNHP